MQIWLMSAGVEGLASSLTDEAVWQLDSGNNDNGLRWYIFKCLLTTPGCVTPLPTTHFCRPLILIDQNLRQVLPNKRPQTSTRTPSSNTEDPTVKFSHVLTMRTTETHHVFDAVQRDFFKLTPTAAESHHSFNDCNSQTGDWNPGSNLFNAYLHLGWYPVIGDRG